LSPPIISEALLLDGHRASRERCIEHREAVLLEFSGDRPRDVGGNRPHIDVDRARLHARKHAVLPQRDLLDRSTVGHDRECEERRARNCGGAVGPRHAFVDERRGTFTRSVPAGHLVACSHESRDDDLSHCAEADESNIH
jgi:hypothetical protein